MPSSRIHYIMQDQVPDLVASLTPTSDPGNSVWVPRLRQLAEFGALSLTGGLCSVILIWQM